MHKSKEVTINLILELRRKGYTYNQIREATGCSKGTISKYCVETNLSFNPKVVDVITPELLQQILQRYEEVRNLHKVAKEYHISSSRLRDAGLQVLKKFSKPRSITPQASCALKTKLKAIEYKGGKCQICGYNKSVRALTFHHINPKDKSFGIAGGTKSFEKLKPELDKCILVCHNCHAEIHDGLIDLDVIKQINLYTI